MSSIWNNRISISFFGEAEGAAIGVTIDGLPAGEFIDSDEIRRYMDRRTPDSYRDENTRRTPLPRIMSGVSGDRTSGGPLCAFIQNVDRRPREERKNELSANTRVGNADYTGAVHFRGYNDVMDRSSRAEKLTAPLCFAGAVCAQILERRGIFTGAHIAQIHNIKDNPYDRVKLDRDAVISVRYKDFPVINDRKGWLMLEDIARAKEAGESLGGIIECAAVNVPAGVGSPIFDVSKTTSLSSFSVYRPLKDSNSERASVQRKWWDVRAATTFTLTSTVTCLPIITAVSSEVYPRVCR